MHDKRQVLFLLLVPLLIGAPSPAVEASGSEDIWTGNGLLRGCLNGLRVLDEGADAVQSLDAALQGEVQRCMAYVTGVWRTYEHFRGTTECDAGDVASVRVDQAIRVVVKYMQDHPEKLHLDVMYLTMEAAAEAFPCKQPSGVGGR